MPEIVPQGGVGGGQRAEVLLVSHGFQKNYERAFANGLCSAGVEVLLVSSDQTDYRALLPGVSTLNLRGSQTEDRSRWIKVLNLFRYHLALMAWVAWHRPPVVHVFGLITPTWLVGRLQGWWFRRFAGRYVLTVHDTEPHDQGDERQRRAFLGAFARAHHLVVHTRRLADDLKRQLGAAAPPIVVMEHGIEPLAAMPVHERRTPGQPVRLLMFGIVMRYKGADVLLDALEGTDLAFELAIVGKCHDAGLRDDLQRRMRHHRHAARIHWRDEFVPEAEMEALFQQSDMLVLPYRRIDQSGVLMQAYRHGLPVVASRVGAFADYVGPDRGETCPPEDPLALRAAIERLAHRLHAIDRSALVAASRRLHWDQVVLALGPVYAGIAALGAHQPD